MRSLERIPRGSELTPTELNVMMLLANGFSRKQISLRFGLKVSTVDTCVERAHRRLRARNTPHAIHLLHQQGILNGSPVQHIPERETP